MFTPITNMQKVEEIMSEDKVIEDRVFMNERTKPRVTLLSGEKSCYGCDNFKQTLGKIHSEGWRCALWPIANFHEVTTKICTPENNKPYWVKKRGFFKRLIDALF